MNTRLFARTNFLSLGILLGILLPVTDGFGQCSAASATVTVPETVFPIGGFEISTLDGVTLDPGPTERVQLLK